MVKIKKSKKKDFTEKLIVTKEEINEGLEKKSKKVDLDNEPSWYHYAIILCVFFLISAGIYYGFEYFGAEEDQAKFLTKTFNYPYKVGNITYNIKFNYPLEILDKSNFLIEPNKIDMLNTINFSRTFFIYNGTDNGQVAIASIKVRNFLKYVYKVNFGGVYYFNESNCSNSNLNSKVMVFDINSTRSGVFYDKENGCVTFETTTAKDIVLLGDKFIYEMIKQ